MKNAYIIENEPDGWKRAWLLIAVDGREVGAFCFRDSAEAYAEDHGYTVTAAPLAYRDMPLSDVMKRQRERLFARSTFYTERGEYSALVTKETGLHGAYWYIVIRKGSEVVSTDIHYAGPVQAHQRAEKMLCAVAGPALVAEDAAAPLCVPGKPLPAAFIVFTVFDLLPSHRPELAAYEFRKVPDGPVFAGAVYPVHRSGALASWVGEPCATLADAERAAAAHAGL